MWYAHHTADMKKRQASTTCPVAAVAELLSDTWTMLIIRDVLRGPQRFGTLAESLAGISTRTLTIKLHRLVEQGIITKKDTGYTITAQGRRLGRIIKAMSQYGEQYL